MGPDDRSTAPDRAFRLLGDPTRVEILRQVWAESPPPVSFTDLREAVGNPDSGRFNYHLDKLVGAFLSKGESGYTLTQAGREVVRAVLAGSLTENPLLEPESFGAHCLDCGGPLVAKYDEYAIIECASCGETVMWNEFPPAGVADRDVTAFAAAFDRWTQHRFRLALDGICPNCACDVTTTVPQAHGESNTELASQHRCENCEYEARVPLFGHVLQHPAVISFYYEDGVDVTDLAYWELRELTAGYTAEITSTDPWRCAVTIQRDARSLQLTLDEELDVQGVTPPDR